MGGCDFTGREMEVTVAYDWRSMHPDWNASNLETEGVMIGAQPNVVWVRDDHPVVRVLEMNTEILSCRVSDTNKVNGHFKVTRQVFNSAVQGLRNNVAAFRVDRWDVPGSPPRGPV